GCPAPHSERHQPRAAMKIFECDHCGNLVFFENVSCVRCHHTLGFIPDAIDLCAVEPVSNGLWQALGRSAASGSFRQCRNWTEFQVCNWFVPEDDENPLCHACRLNLVIPDLSLEANLQLWHKFELAKRRVLYSLLRLQLPTEAEDDRPPLRFKFMADSRGAPPVMTGHSGGVITINIAEADDAERERRRSQFHEPYRTLIGHLRHEIAHYYWERLIAETPRMDKFRALFGDERKSYLDSLKAYYEKGPPSDWENNYVTAYASSHPWEDWAETCAHYLHMSDALETAASFGLSLKPRHPQALTMRADPQKAQDTDDFDQLLQTWIPLTHTLNELNRGMGLPDLYPFVLSSPSAQKLRFIHTFLRNPP
ncbi:MAG TPA: putative zinc-binding peptidase, partial [Verrucomicrobiae bacterium]|nr:putative zinc-binding peptidase [Verrucomicrobiae bacterium]